tara:strand:- start:426 stop:632 length:207 start_codon:yes stop_codon:yes gene_type:complete
MITLEELIEEKNILQSDYDKMASHIRKVELDLSQMKANMNAVDGALQQMRKLINKAQSDESKKKGKEK